MDGPAPVTRFRDATTRFYEYELTAEGIDVVCPRCSGHAAVIAQRVEGQPAMFWSRRFSCTGCGHSARWPAEGRTSCWGAAVDPFFRLPLWLAAPCCGGHTLWAFNRTHLDLLDAFITARLRERNPGAYGQTLVERLPAWIKAAKNRDELRTVLARLRDR
ncbi:hypothetical protein OHA21_11510 [Actinoplanes sp. NBC_00393]|uniref:hypothetical protein n=1 Tax=Actinoplanes sp. NBC_00393 TaxID=2975953 RepID=UPI002E2391DB